MTTARHRIRAGVREQVTADLVRGVQRLRVCDASVMPCIVGGNTNAPTLMIAERCADFMLAGTCPEAGRALTVHDHCAIDQRRSRPPA